MYKFNNNKNSQACIKKILKFFEFFFIKNLSLTLAPLKCSCIWACPDLVEPTNCPGWIQSLEWVLLAWGAFCPGKSNRQTCSKSLYLQLELDEEQASGWYIRMYVFFKKYFYFSYMFKRLSKIYIFLKSNVQHTCYTLTQKISIIHRKFIYYTCIYKFSIIRRKFIYYTCIFNILLNKNKIYL